MTYLPVLSPAQVLLHGLVETISRSLEASTYLHETENLLRVLRKQLRWYEDFLAALRASRLYDEYEGVSQIVREELLRTGERHIENIKGLCEGTTEVIPYEIAGYINHEFDRLCSTHGNPHGDAEGTDKQGGSEQERTNATAPEDGVALCPFRQFNYFYEHVGRSFARLFLNLENETEKHLDALRARVAKLSKRPDFPGGLVMIGFQYAMSRDVLYHSVLFHELGHHVFEARKLHHRYKRQLLEELRGQLPAQKILELADARTRKDAVRSRLFVEQKLNSYLKEGLVPWVGELFADAFAAALAGPQYGLAFHDLTAPLKRGPTFYRNHPADLLRQYQQWITLKASGWVRDTRKKPGMKVGETSDGEKALSDADFESLARDVFSRLQSESDENIKKKKWDLHHIDWAPADILEVIVAVLIRACPRITQHALESVDDAKERSSEFWLLGPHVGKMLEKAIVPSTIILKNRLENVCATSVDSYLGMKQERREGESEAFVYHPQPCTVMNVARLLYQTGCQRLVDSLREPESREGSSKETTFLVYSRVSDWTRKAISDWLILRRNEEHRA